MHQTLIHSLGNIIEQAVRFELGINTAGKISNSNLLNSD